MDDQTAKGALVESKSPKRFLMEHMPNGSVAVIEGGDYHDMIVLRHENSFINLTNLRRNGGWGLTGARYHEVRLLEEGEKVELVITKANKRG